MLREACRISIPGVRSSRNRFKPVARAKSRFIVAEIDVEQMVRCQNLPGLAEDGGDDGAGDEGEERVVFGGGGSCALGFNPGLNLQSPSGAKNEGVFAR
jgi:hypothetical protein